MKLSAAIIAYNEESKLADCLRSIDFVDEIVLVDSGSSDKTVSIAEQFKARVAQRKLDDFSSQKNYAISLTQGEWIFLIDADERVTPELKESILKAVKAPGKFSAFKMTRLNHIFGRTLKHGASGHDQPVRLLKKGAGQYHGLVHEELKINGETGTLQGTMIHITSQTLKDYFAKFEKYTTLDARERLRRNWKKPSLFNLLFRPFLEFFYFYILRLGFLDGWAGFQYQWLSSYYKYTCYAKARHYFESNSKI